MNSTKWVLLDMINKCSGFRSFKQIHAQILASGLASNDLVASSVVGFLGKSVTSVDYACDFLKQLDWRESSFPFNLLISGCASGDAPRAAFLAFRRIVRDGFSPDMFTVPAVMKSCVKFSGKGEGRQVHGVVVKMGFQCDVYVQNSLVHFYSVCGDCGSAVKVFDEMPERDVVSWTGLISGHVKSGLFDEAMSLFSRMDVKPNVATFVSVLVACGRMGYLSVGKVIHGLIFKRSLGTDLVVGNAVLDMYVKCESLCDAKKFFDELPERDIVSWTSMISGLVQCKRARESLELFHDMQSLGIEPDKIILASVLSACASLGALDYGRWVHEYIDPLLSACKAVGDVELSQEILDALLKLKSQDSGAYVLLSNIYATNRRWGDVTMVRKLMKKKGIQKSPGSSVIEVDGKAHEFVVGDTSHPRKDDIHILLNILAKQVYLEGIFPIHS
ncbi:hypothetical protein C1H46_032765 [Malus baccata]|uniref:Pentacotripeptide-repeat region of PRORP domain-containing protein n=1 Tax=Malus baccata TaxID=106549 RepID=A0A540L5Q2_MALBA|nr:hypothetical protein C1H46_032765 [Malus baccata]